MKGFFVVLIEAIVVGLVLLAILSVARLALKDSSIPDLAIVFLSGMIFHLAFEYTGLNKMYVDRYYN